MRFTKFYSQMVSRWYRDEGDPHYFCYYDNLYPDFISDPEDYRYINFRYTDQQVGPHHMTGYYPYENIKYGDFLSEKYNKKE